MKQPEMKHVKLCEKCRGEGEIMGAVMRIFCPRCHGNRFESVPPEAGLSISSLSKELYEARKELAKSLAEFDRDHATGKHRSLSSATEAQRAYYRNNGRGPGGSNFTGD